MTALRISLLIAAGVALLWVLLAIFERAVPDRILKAFWRRSVPIIRPWAGLIPGWAVIETVGRKSGKRRRVPVGGRLDGTTYWVVAGYSRTTNYVRNIRKNPNVRVRVHGRWRKGIALLCPDDNPRRRLLRMNPINSLYLWMAATDLLTIRIDLAA